MAWPWVTSFSAECSVSRGQPTCSLQRERNGTGLKHSRVSDAEQSGMSFVRHRPPRTRSCSLHYQAKWLIRHRAKSNKRKGPPHETLEDLYRKAALSYQDRGHTVVS